MLHSVTPFQLSIVGVFLSATLLTGHLFRKSARTESQFLHARRTLPLLVTSIAFVAANCGSLEIVGLVAASAKYGARALHFYWIGAIPAMVFLALFMMPVYLHSQVLTVPEFLRLRYSHQTQMLNAISLAVMMACISGISLYAVSTVLRILLGWQFLPAVLFTSGIVLGYVLLGGLKAAIYNEVLQLAVTIAGLVPLVYLAMRGFHGLRGIASNLPENMVHVWKGTPLFDSTGSTMDVFGVVVGLGFVLSFGYWCTDFLLIQRALSARTAAGSINTPLIAAVVKLCFPILVVVPGLTAAIFIRQHAMHSFDESLTWLMLHYYGPGLLCLGIAGILASLMSSMAGNVTALSTIWTNDLYKAFLQPRRDDAHYVRMGRLATAVAVVLSIATAYIAFRYNNLMDYLQLIFSLFNAPLFATFLLGMFTTWATPRGGFWGLICGMAASVAHNIAYRLHLGGLRYGSDMLANFYGAVYGWTACMLVTALISCFTERKSLPELEGLTYGTRGLGARRIPKSSWALAIALLAACMALNLVFW